jgi:hypothetical protein
MIDEAAVGSALISLFRAGVWHWGVLVGVAAAMSHAGKSRLAIVDFFWRLMNASPPVLNEEELDFIDDFVNCLLGRCRLEQIIRLHGDPEAWEELGRLVDTEAATWKPPV